MEEGGGGIQSLLQKRVPVDIEFSDLSYTVPNGKSGSKMILRGVNGVFKSGELTAILGPSGAGKSTLLNILAGYRTCGASGSILTNGIQRDLKLFRKMSRYIMQEDVLQPGLSVTESLLFAADLKLGPKFTLDEKMHMVVEIMDMLRLVRCRNTLAEKLSGGERKRLSIALELVNNPAVIFLDEPTTGLDDSASSQCLSLLKDIACGGRTVICSIHTPSARIFSMFDHVYVVAQGQCSYQGSGKDIVQFLGDFGLNCPKTYNPIDFMIDVCCGEYGDHLDKMVMATENGKLIENRPILNNNVYNSEIEINKLKFLPDYGCGTFSQMGVLLRRMFYQQWRDRGSIVFKLCLQVLVGIIIGMLYYKMGNDGSKTIFNFGFCFITVIDFMYIPLLPTLVWFPLEVAIVKREHFNRWYNLNAYFLAMTIAKIPIHMLLGFAYISIAYTVTGQPLEWDRIFKFSCICYAIGFTSESLALAISARLNIIYCIFVGPTLTVPFMLLSVYGIGSPSATIPFYVRLAMYGSYMRWGVEGLVNAVYGGNRDKLFCPDDVVVCEIRNPDYLLKHVGMEDASFTLSIIALIGYVIAFKALAYLLLRSRLRRTSSWGPVAFVGQLIKTHLNVSAYS